MMHRYDCRTEGPRINKEPATPPSPRQNRFVNPACPMVSVQAPKNTKKVETLACRKRAREPTRIDQALQLQGFPALFTSNPSGLSCGPAPTLICRLPSLPPTEFFRSARARGFRSVAEREFWVSCKSVSRVWLCLLGGGARTGHESVAVCLDHSHERVMNSI